MIKISGHVRLQDSNAAVPNLVVAAYDSEKSLDEIIKDHKDGGGFNAGLLECLTKISSVLTDSTGNFLIDKGDISRPNLVIIVSAPEDTIDTKTPVPLPPEKRILYLSVKPRIKAGAEEAYSIRLLQKQIDEFNIPLTTEISTSESSSSSMIAAAVSAWNFKDSLKKKLKEKMQKEHDKSTDLKKLAKEKVKNLSAIPLHLRDNKLQNNDFLILNKKELNANLKPIQDKVIEQGLKRLEKNKDKRRLHLTLTQNDLHDLGLKLDKEGKIKGEIDSQKLSEKIRAITNGVDLIRIRGMNNSSPDELEKKYLLTPYDRKNISAAKK